MGQFNVDEFLQQDYEEALDTDRTLFPVGDWVGKITEAKVKKGAEYKDDETGEIKEGSPRLELTIDLCEEHAERIRKEFNYDADRPVQFRTNFYLDVEDNRLEFGPNKNLQLGKIRAALGQNQPGVRWGLRNLKDSSNLIGFTIRHEEWENKVNGRKGTIERVTAWTAVE